MSTAVDSPRTLTETPTTGISTKTKFFLGFLVFSAFALVVTGLKGSPDLPMDIDPVFGVPTPPGNEVFPYDRTNNVISIVLLGVFGLVGTFFAVKEWIGERRPLAMTVSLSALLIPITEVFLDVIGMVYFPVDSVDNVFTIFGRQMGWFIIAGWFGYGAFNYFTFKVLERRPTTKALWLMLAASAAGAIVFEELLQWAGGMYHYYGNQPLEILRLPQWWTPANAIGCSFLPAMLAYRFRDHMTGIRSLWMFAIAPLSVAAVYGAIAMPSWVVVNGDYPWLPTQLAGLATVGLGIILAAGLMRVVLQRDPWDLSEPAELTDDPALDPQPIIVRRRSEPAVG